MFFSYFKKIMSNTYYEQNATDFFNSTVHIDASLLYERFLPLLPDCGSILDAGCGSGRDTLAFKRQGYQVKAFDASTALSALTQVLTGLPVQTCRFLEFESNTQFDGIWACASLLHLPFAELATNITYLAKYLASDGFFYCSFKYGEEEQTRNGRHFTSMTEEKLALLLKATSLQIFEIWTTSDLRVDRQQEQWLNIILCHQK